MPARLIAVNEDVAGLGRGVLQGVGVQSLVAREGTFGYLRSRDLPSDGVGD